MTSPSVVEGVDLQEMDRVFRICRYLSRYPTSYDYTRLVLAHITIIRTAHQPYTFDFPTIEHQPPKAICAICQCYATIFRDLPDISQPCLKRRLRMRSGLR